MKSFHEFKTVYLKIFFVGYSILQILSYPFILVKIATLGICILRIEA